jgi:uncharacterized protein (DUF2141 family)
MEMYKKKSYFYWTILLLFLVSSCAQQATLTGGDKDVMPPVILKQEPANYSIDFNVKRIQIYFDEYIQLNNPSETFSVSPPMKNQLEYSLKGKSLIIDIKDTLKENTTYVINCSEGIKDLTEGNPLPLTSFVFSTGSYVDSLSFFGSVKDAFTLSPVEKVAVLLFQHNEDSTLLKDEYYYFTVTDNHGHFRFSNLASGKYHLCALNDKNRNFIFDQTDESIAFFSDLVEPVYIPVPVEDTLSVLEADTAIVQDSIPAFEIDYEEYILWMFEEQDTTLRFLRREFKSDYRHDFIFKNPIRDFKLNQISQLDTVISYLTQFNKSKDTISIYLTSISHDLIDFELFANEQLLDTITFNPSQKGSAGGGRRRGAARATTDTTKVFLTYKIITKGELHKDPSIEFSYPVQSYDLSKFLLVEHLKTKIDTMSVESYFTDSLKMRLAFRYPFKEKTRYEILSPDSIFLSYFGHSNDSIKIDFTTKSQKDYVSLRINYEFYEKNNFIVQLLNEKSNVLQEDFLSSDEGITYVYLNPGKYRIRVIEDVNNNKKWDSGKYTIRRQPEKVFYFDKPIDIPANWKIEETFEVGVETEHIH